MQYYVLLIIMTFLGSIASVYLKKASGFNNIKELLININLYIGGILYLLSAVLNIYVLKFLDYSVVLPLTSITYIWTMMFSHYIFKEIITVKKIAGLICIFLGAFFITII